MNQSNGVGVVMNYRNDVCSALQWYVHCKVEAICLVWMMNAIMKYMVQYIDYIGYKIPRMMRN